jgi:hypothetical protein
MLHMKAAAAKQLTLLTRIWKLPDSDLGTYSGYTQLTKVKDRSPQLLGADFGLAT